MNAIFDFLNQPIILTVISLIVGSYLLSIVAEHRSRKNKLRDQAIEFLTEAGDIITKIVPHIYEQLRTGNITVTQGITNELKELFSRRIFIQVGSQVYLKSDTFHMQYFRLLDEISAVIVHMTALEQGADEEDAVAKIQEFQTRLVNAWPLATETLDPNTGKPVDELIIWMDMILHRATYLLSSHLKAIV